MASLMTGTPLMAPMRIGSPRMLSAAIFPDAAMLGRTMRLRHVIVVISKGLREGRRGQQRDHAEYQPPHARQSVVCRGQHRRNGLTSR